MVDDKMEDREQNETSFSKGLSNAMRELGMFFGHIPRNVGKGAKKVRDYFVPERNLYQAMPTLIVNSEQTAQPQAEQPAQPQAEQTAQPQAEQTAQPQAEQPAQPQLNASIESNIPIASSEALESYRRASKLGFRRRLIGYAATLGLLAGAYLLFKGKGDDSNQTERKIPLVSLEEIARARSENRPVQSSNEPVYTVPPARFIQEPARESEQPRTDEKYDELKEGLDGVKTEVEQNKKELAEEKVNNYAKLSELAENMKKYSETIGNTFNSMKNDLVKRIETHYQEAQKNDKAKEQRLQQIEEREENARKRRSAEKIPTGAQQPISKNRTTETATRNAYEEGDNARLSVAGGNGIRVAGSIKYGSIKAEADYLAKVNDSKIGNDDLETRINAVRAGASYNDKDKKFKLGLWMNFADVFEDQEGGYQTQSTSNELVRVINDERANWEQDSERRLLAGSAYAKINDALIKGDDIELILEGVNDETKTKYGNNIFTLLTFPDNPEILPNLVSTNVRSELERKSRTLTGKLGYGNEEFEIGGILRHKDIDVKSGANVNGVPALSMDEEFEINSYGGFAGLNLEDIKGRGIILRNNGDGIDSKNKVEGAAHIIGRAGDKLTLGAGYERSEGGHKGRVLAAYRLSDGGIDAPDNLLSIVESHVSANEDYNLFGESTIQEQKDIDNILRGMDIAKTAGGIYACFEGGKKGKEYNLANNERDYWAVEAAVNLMGNLNLAGRYEQIGKDSRKIGAGASLDLGKGFSGEAMYLHDKNGESDQTDNMFLIGGSVKFGGGKKK